VTLLTADKFSVVVGDIDCGAIRRVYRWLFTACSALSQTRHWCRPVWPLRCLCWIL